MTGVFSADIVPPILSQFDKDNHQMKSATYHDVARLSAKPFVSHEVYLTSYRHKFTANLAAVQIFSLFMRSLHLDNSGNHALYSNTLSLPYGKLARTHGLGISS